MQLQSTLLLNVSTIFRIYKTWKSNMIKNVKKKGREQYPPDTFVDILVAELMKPPHILSFFRAISATRMFTDVSQIGVAHFPS